jgi:hypothetical protein
MQPNNEDAVQIAEVCINVVVTKERTCPSLIDTDNPYIITATYPKPLTPGEQLRFEVTFIPHSPYQLREDRGDFLSNTDEREENLLGAWPVLSVKGTIDPGQPFTFTDYDNPLIVPQLAEGEQERVFTSTWRVWMHTRYVGPSIRIVFTGQRP